MSVEEKPSLLKFEISKRRVPRDVVMGFSRQLSVFISAGIPILAASGDTHLAGGADALLAKPYDDRRLIMLVNSLLEKGREVR